MTEEITTWFNSWDRIQSIAIGGVFFFIFVVVLVRITGKRTTSQMNNFDWIITVAIGGLVSSGILLENVSIADAVAGIIVLAACQWLTTWAVRESEWFCKLMKATPRLLTHKGQLLKDAMRAERVSEAEIYAKLRENGCVSLEDANWVILETDGNMTVIPRQNIEFEDAQLMENVEGQP